MRSGNAGDQAWLVGWTRPGNRTGQDPATELCPSGIKVGFFSGFKEATMLVECKTDKKPDQDF
jgi:hypothetical protein